MKFVLRITMSNEGVYY